FCVMNTKSHSNLNSKNYLPNLSVDIVIIGYEDAQLKCLLLKMGENWCLPGGFIKREESVENATRRVLKERTGLSNPHLNFLAVFGDRDRSFGQQLQNSTEKEGKTWIYEDWFHNRFVTLAYYSLVNIEHTRPSIHQYFDEAFAWFNFDELPNMWMDHESIIQSARDRIKKDIQTTFNAHNLLSSPFTMPELHQLHQIILEENIDRSRFQKKMIATGMFKRLDERQKETRGRKPYQYVVED
ncbi:MAG: NUDIX hydrolase, partial [Bacteroidota bacterium]